MTRAHDCPQPPCAPRSSSPLPWPPRGRRLRHRPHHALLVRTATDGAGRHPRSALIAQGQYLSRAADCAACHRAGGKPFAGGLGMQTPMGTIYSTNITPDPDTGIGATTRRLRARGSPRHPTTASRCIRRCRMPLRDRQRYRDQGAVRLLHGLGAAGETGQRRQHDSVAGQHALAAGLVAAAVRTPAQLQPGSGAGCRPAARCRTGGRPGPLRRLPHATRPGLPGKGDGR
jgi:hypothetical protein